MNGINFDGLTRRQFGVTAATLLALAGSDNAEAKRKKHKRKRKHKKKEGLCRPNGERCGNPGQTCNATFCLNAPLTIEAIWTVPADHDSYLFVPPENAPTGPSPLIDYDCDAASHTCEDGHPFACASGDETSADSEVTTIFALLGGRYEYWIELNDSTAAGELMIVLREAGGRIVQQWANPANPAATDKSWHVFDINGSTASIASIDVLIDAQLPEGAHVPSTNVCRF